MQAYLANERKAAEVASALAQATFVQNAMLPRDHPKINPWLSSPYHLDEKFQPLIGALGEPMKKAVRPDSGDASYIFQVPLCVLVCCVCVCCVCVLCVCVVCVLCVCACCECVCCVCVVCVRVALCCMKERSIAKEPSGYRADIVSCTAI